MHTFIELLKALLFGIVEGITEWLPVSSTGHLILLQEFVNFDGVSEGFWEMFEVVVQLGAILAVIVLFWSKIWPFSAKKVNGKRTVLKKNSLLLWAKVIIACLPAAVVGLLFDDIINELFYNPMTVGIMLALVGIAFIVIERLNRSKVPKTESLEDITFSQALIIGIFQLVSAVFPGTSRSGSTILGGLMLGISRTAAAEFTFILGIPVMFGASLLKIVKFGFAFTSLELAVLAAGTVTAFLVSLAVIRFLMDFVRRHSFNVFGWYRIALGAVVIAYFIIK